ncbi:WYL domain-containing protein [Aquihabitans sp. G128]|uniref:helix-turn-helix transcriptional regulator n=1 Tax=Aquihabitans sp. G128 TaxID=2849779 RepID=UPI001C21F972|nr:WYL domain-containing protein [Aquihabitans sp. G128]QXC62035.1 WYL domain-containing protein [Aquihabitans sp. G128]
MAQAKIERLITLMNALLGAPRPVTAAELRRRVPGYPDEDASFKRAFERDKDELREMGVPLLVESVPGTDPPILGYRIRPRDYELRDPGLDAEELEALNLAAAVVASDGGMGQRALFKLGGVAAATAPVAEIPADPDLVAAFTGVAERRSLRFGYHGVERVVNPYRLEFLRGRWYLNGFDHVRGEERWYRMSRVEGGVALDTPPSAFERPVEAVPGLRLDPWVLGGHTDPVTAEVWFDPAVAAAVRAELGDAQVVSDDDSGLVVSLVVTNREGFRSWLLAFLDRAELRSPPELRAELVGWLEEVAAR